MSTNQQDKYLIPVTRLLRKEGWVVDYSKDAKSFVDATSYINTIVEKAKQQAREEFAREIKEKMSECIETIDVCFDHHVLDIIDELLQGVE